MERVVTADFPLCARVFRRGSARKNQFGLPACMQPDVTDAIYLSDFVSGNRAAQLADQIDMGTWAPDHPSTGAGGFARVSSRVISSRQR